jgi:hypothetical protein
MTAGLGIERKVGGFNVAPRVRYTRWAADKVDNRFESETLRNQVEFLVSLSRAAETNWRPLGRRFSVGIL